MANYIGNNDYRGWLNYLAQNGDATAGVLLQTVGNDGKSSDYHAVYDTEILGQKYADEAKDIARGKAVADRYYNAYQNSLNNNSGEGSTTYRSSGGTSNYDANAVNAYNQAINQTNHELGLLDSRLGEKNKDTENQYQTRQNELQGAYDKAKQTYDTQSANNRNNLLTNKNTITDRANAGLKGLLRILGAQGAGNSSAALYSAPELVAAQAAQEAAGINSTFRENQQNLDTNWNNYRADYDDDKKRLDDWRTLQIKANEQDIINTRKNLLAQLANAYSGRASAGQADGGNLANITERINQANTRLSELGQFTQPTYTGVKSVYNAPTLSSYNTGTRKVDSTATETAKTGASSPTLAVLLGVDKRRDDEE